MASVGFGAFTQRASFSQGFVHSNATLPGSPYNGSDGSNWIVVTDLAGAISGNGGTRTGTIYCGSSSAGFSRASSGSAQDTGNIDTSDWLVAGGTGVEYGYQSLSGSCFFARGANGTGFTQGAFGTFSGSVGMTVFYWYIPSPASITSVTPSTDGTSSVVVLGAPGDNGGAAITGYNIQRATDTGFTTNLATVGSTGTSTLAGLTPGTRYYYRVTPRNYVTDSAGILGGPWSSTVFADQPQAVGLGRRYTASSSAFIAQDGKRWNASTSTWQFIEGRRWNASTSTWDKLGR